MSIKNPDLLLKKYLTKFNKCIQKRGLLSETEITNKVGIGKTLFEQKYLPKLRNLSLIVTIPKEKENKKQIEELKKAGKNIERAKNKYYFFTPKASRINLIFDRFIKNVGRYLDNKEEVYSKQKELIKMLQCYELETTISCWNKEVDKNFKVNLINDIKISKNPKILQEDFLKNTLGETLFIISEFLVSCFKDNPIPSMIVVKLKMEINMKTEEFLKTLDKSLNVKKMLDIESKNALKEGIKF